VLLAKLGLDGHDRGLLLIAHALRDQGHEVILLGIGTTPNMLANAAIQEDVQVIGVSMLSGSHMTLVIDLIRRLRESGAGDIPVVCGGTIPLADRSALIEGGVKAVLGTGSSVEAAAASLIAWARDDRSLPLGDMASPAAQDMT